MPDTSAHLYNRPENISKEGKKMWCRRWGWSILGEWVDYSEYATASGYIHWGNHVSNDHIAHDFRQQFEEQVYYLTWDRHRIWWKCFSKGNLVTVSFKGNVN